MTYRSLKLCSSGGAYEAIPDPKLQLDLKEACATLRAADREVVDARVMLILPGTPEVTLTREGKIVVKTRDPGEAERTFRELARLLGLPSTASG